jgi:hypothetical protein
MLVKQFQITPRDTQIYVSSVKNPGFVEPKSHFFRCFRAVKESSRGNESVSADLSQTSSMIIARWLSAS